MYHTLVSSNIFMTPFQKGILNLLCWSPTLHSKHLLTLRTAPDAEFGEHNEIITVSAVPTLASEIHFLLNEYNVS